MSAPAIEFRGVSKAFGGRPVLRGLDLRVAVGETFTILGGSGSGKSVCLKHMIGLLRADSGEIRVFGEDVTRFSEVAWVPVRRRFGMVFQGAALFDSLSVLENVAWPLREHQRAGEEQIRRRVADCLAAVGLPGIEAMLPSELSGGMRKRVGVARAIALAPEVILYDEPTTGLDPANARRIGALIHQLQEELHITGVVVTHDLELCFAVSDRVALLRDGRIAVVDAPGNLRRSDHPELRAFLDGEGEPDASAALRGNPDEEWSHG